MTNTVSLSNKAWQALAYSVQKRSNLSPLPDVATPSESAEGRKQLAKSGILDGNGAAVADWQPALDALGRPLRHITIVVGSFDGVSTLRACQGPQSYNHYAVYAAKGSGAISLAYPVEPPDLTLPIFEALGLESNSPDLGIGADLSVGAFAALTGLADALREAEAEALLSRDHEPVAGVTASAVALSLKLGWASADYRWLVPMARSMIPVPVTIDVQAVQAGLDELIEVGIATRSPETSLYLFKSGFAMPGRTLTVPIAFGVVALTEVADDRVVHAWLCALRVLGAFWAFEFVAGSPNLMRIRTLPESEFLGMLGEILARSPVATTRTSGPAPAEAHRFCSACGAPLVAGAKFCSHCGKPA